MTDIGESNQIATYTVKCWVRDVGDGKIVLPMIQRGSVWKPHQILDLWDTLLQAMPLGAFMTSPIKKEGTKVFDLLTREMMPVPRGAISLLDGQQRTLAILSAWPGFEDKLQRRVAVWVDLGTLPAAEHSFRLWITTRAQPFGYERASVGGQALGKLSVADRRLANALYNTEGSPEGLSTDAVIERWNSDAFMPWRATFPIRLSRLIQEPHLLDAIDERLLEKEEALQRLLEVRGGVKLDEEIDEEIKKKIENWIKNLRELRTDKIDVMRMRSRQLQKAVRCIPAAMFPLIPVERHIDGTADWEGDPPIAVLFKRIAGGGQPLSNEDYVFSVLKYHEPEVHTLVEGLLAKDRIAALYTANNLVMAAVRAQLLQLRTSAHDDKMREYFRDAARIDKARFSRLSQDRGNDFSGAFKSLIGKEGRFAATLDGLLGAITYADDFREGLPLHAFPWLVDRFLFDVLVAWFIESDEDPTSCRLQLVRFLLWGFLCIRDKAAASEFCLRELPRLKESESAFPETALMRTLIGKGFAYALPSPNVIKGEKIAFTEEERESHVLRGALRFTNEPVEGGHVAEVYRRWWNTRDDRHEHPFLLWLQREFVSKEFEEQKALAGMDEDTPYDFDHILPQSNWGRWTGFKNDRLIDFATDKKWDHYVLGNAIGNLRVWPASINRKDGDASPMVKLRLDPNRGDGSEGLILAQSCIESGHQLAAWKKVSGDGKFVKFAWDRARALAFQEAVESRTFALYESFYADLHFDDLASDFREALEKKNVADARGS